MGNLTLGLKNLNFIENINSKGLGECSVYKVDNSELKVLGKNLFESSIDIESRCKFSHPNIYKTLKYEKSLKNLISREGHHVFFEMPQLSLFHIFQLRKANFVKEIDILHFGKDISSALNYFHSKNVVHGNIQLNTIYYDTKSLIFKIFDQELFTGKNSAIKMAIKGIRDPFFSTEEVLSVNEGGKNVSEIPTGTKI